MLDGILNLGIEECIPRILNSIEATTFVMSLRLFSQNNNDCTLGIDPLVVIVVQIFCGNSVTRKDEGPLFLANGCADRQRTKSIFKLPSLFFLLTTLLSLRRDLNEVRFAVGRLRAE